MNLTILPMLSLLVLTMSLNPTDAYSLSKHSDSSEVQKFEKDAVETSLAPTIVGTIFTLPPYVISVFVSQENVKFDFVTYSIFALNLSICPSFGYFFADLKRYAWRGIALKLAIMSIPLGLGIAAYHFGNQSCEKEDDTCWTNENSAKFALFWSSFVATSGSVAISVLQMIFLKKRMRRNEESKQNALTIFPISSKQNTKFDGLVLGLQNTF